ncbi:MAG: response regulator [Rhizobiales bacterium]|nr:response regulator [Hyphomicrobiales bacterium]
MEEQPDLYRIIIVEDDREVGDLVRGLLEREGFAVFLARSGAEMDQLMAEQVSDLVILDLMLPGEDGISICRRLRARSAVPIIMLTAKSDDIDRIIGLELGADDYVGKPFNPRELVARIRSVLRRTARAVGVPQSGAERLRFANFIFDVDARRLWRDGQEIELSTGDYDLLTALTSNPRRLLSRDQLMDMTKGRNWEAFDRSIDVALSRLRRKIEADPAQPELIKTVRNAGYMLMVTVEPA